MANSIRIQTADRSDYRTIAELIAAQNRSPRTRCLHSDEGSASGVLFTMNKWADEDSMAFVFAQDANERIVGAFGAEFDAQQRRAWLWGPFALDGEGNPKAWLALCKTLYDKLITALPFEPALLDGFIEQTFEMGAQLYESCGHHHAKTIYVFTAPRPTDLLAPAEPLPKLTADFADDFAALFDAIFPDTFYTGAQVVERLNDQEQVFIYAEDNTVLGFCHVSVNEGAHEGYIEFIGVETRARQRGIGRRLLETAMFWLFEKHQLPQIGLTTGDDNVNAQALYHQAGFRLDHTGLAYRKRRKEV